MLIRHEGFRQFPYKCSEGYLTIGVGRCIEINGITEHEAMYLLSNDIDNAIKDCEESFSWFKQLDEVRKDVIINMVFNLGLVNFSKFKKTIAYISRKEYDFAATEMLESEWSKQVGQRAVELSEMMRSGKYSSANTRH
jgi:lysozyme